MYRLYIFYMFPANVSVAPNVPYKGAKSLLTTSSIIQDSTAIYVQQVVTNYPSCLQRKASRPT